MQMSEHPAYQAFNCFCGPARKGAQFGGVCIAPQSGYHRVQDAASARQPACRRPQSHYCCMWAFSIRTRFWLRSLSVAEMGIHWAVVEVAAVTSLWMVT